MKALGLGVAFALALPLVGCGDDKDDSGDSGGGICPKTDKLGDTLSGATCPSDSKLTYADDIQPIMEKYCVSCHSSELTGTSARMCAPGDHNFETEDGLIEEAHHVDLSAAAGPDSVNTQMPPKGYPAPSEAERKKLGEWLACNADVTAEDDD